MEFILQVDEGIVRLDVEFDVSQDGSDNILTDLFSLRLDDDLLLGRWLRKLVLWELTFADVALDSLSDTFEAQKVVSVCWHLNFIHDNVIHGDFGSCAVNSVHAHLESCTKFQLKSNLETEIFELLVGCKDRKNNIKNLDGLITY